MVANHIKALSREIINTSHIITKKINTTRRVTGESVSINETNYHKIDQLNTTVASLAAGLEEQSVTTSDISEHTSTITTTLSKMISLQQDLSGAVTSINQRMGTITHNNNNIVNSVKEIGGDLGQINQKIEYIDHATGTNFEQLTSLEELSATLREISLSLKKQIATFRIK